MRSKKPDTIRLVSLEDVVRAATPENYERLMQDVALWAYTMMVARNFLGDSQMSAMAMDWTDDGVNEITGYDIEIRKP